MIYQSLTYITEKNCPLQIEFCMAVHMSEGMFSDTVA